MKMYIQKLKSAVKKVPLFLAMAVILLCSMPGVSMAADEWEPVLQVEAKSEHWEDGTARVPLPTDFSIDSSAQYKLTYESDGDLIEIISDADESGEYVSFTRGIWIFRFDALDFWLEFDDEDYYFEGSVFNLYVNTASSDVGTGSVPESDSPSVVVPLPDVSDFIPALNVYQSPSQLYVNEEGEDYSVGIAALLVDVNKYDIYLYMDGEYYPATVVDVISETDFHFSFSTDNISTFHSSTGYYYFRLNDDCEAALYAVEKPKVPAADNETFLDHATNTLNWFITTMGTLLGFLLKNPICFIGLIATIVIAAVGTTRHVTGG